MGSIKIRAKMKGEITEVRTLIKHKMETGLRKDKKTKEFIPAHFIQEVTAKHGDIEIVHAHWGGAISKNPYFSFQFKGGKSGDDITIDWIDNKGEKDSTTAKIK
jgi:sulfur-oxidizing protein SoxZ